MAATRPLSLTTDPDPPEERGGTRVSRRRLFLLAIARLAASLLAPPGRSSLYRDLGRLFRADPNDAKWLRYAGYALLGARIKQPPTAKFNAGQKLNTLASALFTLEATDTHAADR
jgi:hypothetical protein